eukprot:CAMPEP_0197194382 /NCGR_PEP_ID=MMETSP1423-20130617/29144_1 /TAXON_ID=476441 /ORGANISM="Pseudo-nitzschia heimii, Strain UNC1101" /LENGTH=1018 /DNA_ID=CAMNT_0042647799 /DNA_START=339 /DNA_END=3395 /DNA_ORIENTATION=+
MNIPSLSLEPSKSNEDIIGTPPRLELKFPPISTPDYCPFSVEVEASNSNSLDMLRLSTGNKSWCLSMRTTNSNLLDKGESEDKDETEGEEDDFPLNEIVRALSHEKAPVGLIPISSDSESSSRDDSIDSIDNDSEDEGSSAILPRNIPGSGAAHLHDRHLSCALSPRLSKTPTRGDVQRQHKAPMGPSTPLNSLKVLNPGVPQGHANHRPLKQINSYNSMSGNPRTPKRGDSHALVTSNSNVANSSAADCMCFAIEDVAAFFCPTTPKSTLIDTSTHCPVETDCFPVYYTTTPTPSGDLNRPFFPIQNSLLSPKISPLPRNRVEQFEAMFLLNANLPRNRGHSQRQKHVKKLLIVWHGTADVDTNWFGCRDDFHLLDNRRRKRNLAQPKVCYDSDPEQEVRGRWKRRANLLTSKRRLPGGSKPEVDGEEPYLRDENVPRRKQQPRFRKFRPAPFTHLDTDAETVSEDEESSSDDDVSSYETAKCASSPISHPVAPRNSNPKISFDFGKNLATVDVDSESDDETTCCTHQNGVGAATEPKTEDQTGARFVKKDQRRELSLTSSSTTGHSRFCTIRRSSDQLQEESVSSESSSAGFSSLSESTRLQKAQSSGWKQQKHMIPSYFKSHPTHWTEFQLLFSRNVDEDSVKGHVHELSNVRFPLIWHPTTVSTQSSLKTKAEAKATAANTGNIYCPTSVKIASLFSNSSSSMSSKTKTTNRKGTPIPIGVHGTFEVGSHLEHMVVQPKFTWTPQAQPHRIEGEANANHHELFLNGSAPPQIELLSIIRVIKATPTQLDRKLYPYARCDKTCVVYTNDTNYPTIVLEARTTQERDWLVFSLKLIVARLASIIITRDEDMLHEFFSPYSALMQLEEEEESASRSQNTEKSTDSPRVSKTVDEDASSTIECTATPTTTCKKAAVVIDVDGSHDYVFPDKPETNDDVVFNDCTSDSGIEDLEELDTDDDDDEGDYQHRDDLENEDSIRARNSGAYAILKRSLTATGSLNDHDPHYHHEEYMQRTFSY